MYIIFNLLVLDFYGTFRIQQFCFEYIPTERTELIKILGSKRTVSVQHPFRNISGHVVQTKVVWPVGLHRCGNICSVVQTSGNSHIISATSYEVRTNLTSEFCVVLTYPVSVPWIETTICNILCSCLEVSNQTKGGIFPLGFSRESVTRQQNTVFHAYDTCS